MSPQQKQDLEAVIEASEMYQAALHAAEAAMMKRDRMIREAHARGASLGVIADALGVSKPNIGRIVLKQD